LNQKKRTRDALVGATIALLRECHSPTVSEVAQRALVSPATAYRYFPSAPSLWIAVLEALGEPSADEVFAGLQHADAQTRVRALIERVGFRMLDDEALWRTASRALREPFAGSGAGGERVPLRTGQRMRWIGAALEPFERDLPKEQARLLGNALALVLGFEAVTTLRDVCKLEVDECKRVSLWAAQALVQAALGSAAGKRAKKK
jgi:AcrR family transcriptional regulator